MMIKRNRIQDFEIREKRKVLYPGNFINSREIWTICHSIFLLKYPLLIDMIMFSGI